ncbi:hypothetical protein [Streptomyces sp. NPDC050535]|uniref:hypothetical protein n=1 Tax=Streptomyces sp. NPDC050535 TaxID=3365626 RepID=UPI0037A2D47A
MPNSTLLAQRMAELGLTYQGLAQRIFENSGRTMRPDPSLVWRWMNGKTRPGNGYVTHLAQVLGVEQDVLKADFSKERPRESRPGTDHGAGSPVVARTLREARDAVRRRNFLKSGIGMAAWGLGGGKLEPISPEALRLAEITGSSEVSDGSIDAIGILVDHFAGNFTRYDQREIIKELVPYVGKLTDALSGPLACKKRGELCLSGARMAGLLGRASRSIGRLDDARLYFGSSFYLAEEINHHDMMSWTTLEEATMYYQAGAPQAAHQLVEAALPYSHAGNLVQVLSLQARTSALLSMPHEAVKAISETERRIGAIRPDEDSDLQNVVFNGWGTSPSMHALGRAWLWLGRSREASEFGAQAMRTADQATSMWRHQNHAQGQLVLAGSLAQAGEPEEACRLAESVLSTLHHSAYILITQSTDLMQYLQEHQEMDAVQHLASMLTVYRSPANPQHGNIISS